MELCTYFSSQNCKQIILFKLVVLLNVHGESFMNTTCRSITNKLLQLCKTTRSVTCLVGGKGVPQSWPGQGYPLVRTGVPLSQYWVIPGHDWDTPWARTRVPPERIWDQRPGKESGIGAPSPQPGVDGQTN